MERDFFFKIVEKETYAVNSTTLSGQSYILHDSTVNLYNLNFFLHSYTYYI